MHPEGWCALYRWQRVSFIRHLLYANADHLQLPVPQGPRRIRVVISFAACDRQPCLRRHSDFRHLRTFFFSQLTRPCTITALQTSNFLAEGNLHDDVMILTHTTSATASTLTFSGRRGQVGCDSNHNGALILSFTSSKQGSLRSPSPVLNKISTRLDTSMGSASKILVCQCLLEAVCSRTTPSARVPDLVQGISFSSPSCSHTLILQVSRRSWCAGTSLAGCVTTKRANKQAHKSLNWIHAGY